MKKLLALLLVAIMALSLAACGETPSEPVVTDEPSVTDAPQQDEKKEIDLAALNEKIITLLDDEPLPIDKDGIADLYGMTVDEIADAVCTASMGGAFPEETVIVKAADENSKKHIISCFEQKLADVFEQSENYDEETFALVKKCKVMENGDYVALFIAMNHEAMEKAFEDAFK